MAEINGMAYIKLYKNKACTREMDKDTLGNYIINQDLITDNVQNSYQNLIWVKNIGNHNAYKVNIHIDTVTGSITPNMNFLNGITLTPNEIALAKLSFNIPAELEETLTISLGLNYDSI